MSRDTDIAVRSFLAQRGLKKGDLSRFNEEAVRWRLFEQTLAEARSKLADLPPDEMEKMLEEAVTTARETKAPKAG